MGFAVARVTLDERTRYYFGNYFRNRMKCEFLAHFPDEGVAQSELIKKKVFGVKTKSGVSEHLSSFRHCLEDVLGGCNNRAKILSLNEEGKELQGVARYMLIMNEELNEKFEASVDFLSIFYEKANPMKMIKTLTKIYFNGQSRMQDLFGAKWNCWDLNHVKHLEYFGLVKIESEIFHGKTHTCVTKTELGNNFYYKLLLPVIETITATCEKLNCELHKYMMDGHWENYVKKNGDGWSEKVK